MNGHQAELGLSVGLERDSLNLVRVSIASCEKSEYSARICCRGSLKFLDPYIWYY